MNIALALQKEEYRLAEETAIIGEILNYCTKDRQTKLAVEQIIIEMLEVDYDLFPNVCYRAIAEFNRRLTFKRLKLGLTEFQRLYENKTVYTTQDWVK